MKLVVLVEEASMKEVLDILLPSLLPPDIAFKVVPFNGRGDLENNIVRKLRGWNEPDVHFVIVEDQDNADCRQRKQNLVDLVGATGKTALVRIACRELEAWYFGDLEAVALAYNRPDIPARYGRKRKYRETDLIWDVKEEFLKIVPEHQQISGARRIAPCMDIERNSSPSFQAFVSGVRCMLAEADDD